MARDRPRGPRALLRAADHAALIDSEETTLQWWDAVDLIGIDVYYPLIDDFPRPSMS